jgi:hypothetical protein
VDLGLERAGGDVVAPSDLLRSEMPLLAAPLLDMLRTRQKCRNLLRTRYALDVDGFFISEENQASIV